MRLGLLAFCRASDDDVKSRFGVDVASGERYSVVELAAGIYDALPIWRDANLGLIHTRTG